MLWKRAASSPLLLIVALCAILRLGVLLSFPQVFAFDQTGVFHGIKDYDVYAQNLLTTGVYGATPGQADTLIPPLYAYALAALYAVFGRGYLQVGLFHIVLDGLTILMLFQIGKRLMPSGRTVALLACLFYAIYPYLIFQNLTIVDTPIFMTLLHAYVLTMILLREQKTLNRTTWIIAILGGLILGLGALSRAVIAPLALFVAVWFLFRLSFWQTLLRLLPVAVVSMLTLVPWTLRNYQVYGAFVPITTNAGGNFWIGNSPFTAPLMKEGYHTHWLPPVEPMEGMNDYQKNTRLQTLAIQYLTQHLDKLPELWWVKFRAYWTIEVFPTRQPSGQMIENYKGLVKLNTEDPNRILVEGLPLDDPSLVYNQPLFDQVGRTVHRVYFGSLLVLAVIGIYLSLRYWREVALLWFVQFSMTIIYVVIVPATRYRVPTDPMLFLFSGYTIVVLFNLLSSRPLIQRFLPRANYQA